MSVNNSRLDAAFAAGMISGQENPTKLEQRFSPFTVGNSLYGRRRYLSPAEREGLVPIRGDYRNYPVRKPEEEK